MKKKIWIPIVIIVAVLAILFVPIPQGAYDDGGTREWVSLTYKIVDWNRISADGVYEEVRFYGPADKNKSIDELWEREMQKKDILLSGILNEKEVFSEKADEIKEYSKKHLESATTQYELNTESGIVCEKWDALLSEVYEYLEKELPESKLIKLQDNELEWLSEKEKAINDAAEEWKGGSGEPMARNMAAINCMENRFYYLISLLK